MTDREKIKAELEKRYKTNLLGSHSAFRNGKCEAFRELLSFINNLPEEPVSEDLTEEFNRFLNNVEGMPRMWHPDEQLEWGKDIARHFAQWQREQMMKEAVPAEAVLNYYGNGEKEYYSVANEEVDGEKYGLRDGKKVKLIIVKEE